MLQIKPPGLSMGMAQKLHNSTLQVTTVTSTHLWSCKMVYNGYWNLSCWKMMLKSTLWFGFGIDSFGLKSNNRDQTSISSTGLYKNQQRWFTDLAWNFGQLVVLIWITNGIKFNKSILLFHLKQLSKRYLRRKIVQVLKETILTWCSHS